MNKQLSFATRINRIHVSSLRALALGLVACAVAGSAVACGGDTPPPNTPPTTQQTTTTTTTTSAVAPPVARDPNAAVNLSDEILRQCGVKVNQVQESPKFNFDSTDLSNAEKDILNQVASCLTTGPLKGRKVQLVGRADPRGEQEYNMELGENRANTVKKYMTGLGVAADHVSLTSRGKLDATGTDEAGWAKDRRVDISLLP
jgi:peptidoglycan-associated lipoprotein